jgi:NADH-quinone oxidoreductase subunit L
MERKWWVDELYWAVIANPYIALSRFLADVVDWRFWHDWFHDTVIAGGFTLLSRLLAVRIDLGFIDAIFNGAATLVQRSAGRLRGIQNGFVRSYALSVFLGVVVILGYLILR